MNKLYICNTYYQFILSVQMSLSIHQHEHNFLVITDQTKNFLDVFSKLKDNSGIFEKVFFFETKKMCDRKESIFQYFGDIRKCVLGTEEFSLLHDLYIDEMIFFNHDYATICIYDCLQKNNREIVLSRMEEGLLSYTAINRNKRYSLICNIRKLFNKKSLEELEKKIYAFFPQVYIGKLEPIAVPLVSEHSLTAISLSNIFDPDLSIYKFKYIFFTSVYDFEGGKPVGEYELVCKIADLVGKENLLVKTHPRDLRTIYIDNGFNVDKNSNIPWEVIQLSGDFSDKVFMTINSGSVLSGSTMSEKPVRTYYMYKLCDISGNAACKKNARDIEKLLSDRNMQEVLRTVKIADQLENIL